MPRPYQEYLQAIADYESEFKPWTARVEKIIDKYRDAKRASSGDDSKRFNILWSNVQTLTAATFAKLPRADVSRRFSDNDPVGRVASMILERALEYELDQYPDYRATMRGSVQDRFLGGRGTAWIRYEPHMRAQQMQLPPDGVETTEDVDAPDEELDYECAPTDYVSWRDFGHSVARTWEEVTLTWRKVYLTKAASDKRFEKWKGRLPMDASPEVQGQNVNLESYKRALVYEIWDKETKEAVWLSKSVDELLDVKADPLALQNFFPCPTPLYATLTTDKLEPVPDYSLYQDQAEELSVLADRIDGLVKALKVRGVYDATCPQLAELFTEAGNGTLVPVTNWAAFAEKQGLKGAIDIVDLTNIASALQEAYLAFAQIKEQVYEITGISDIIRGQTVASETATAQQIKGQYASLRLKNYQDSVGEYAAELLRMKAQVMCGKFAPDTLLQMSAADQMSEEDKQLIPQAMQLLLGERAVNPKADSPNPVRNFRIEVSADSLVFQDEQQQKQDRIEFLGAASQFLEKAVAAGEQVPEIAPLAIEMLKFGIGGFKAARQIEGVFDAVGEQLKQAAQQPRPNPEAAQANADMQAKAAELQATQQTEAARMQMDQQKAAAELQLEQQKLMASGEIEKLKAEYTQQCEQMKLMHDAEKTRMQYEFQRWSEELKATTAITVAEIGANSKLQQASMSNAANAEQADKDRAMQAMEGEDEAPEADEGESELAKVITGIYQVLDKLSQPRRVMRGPDGRMAEIH